MAIVVEDGTGLEDANSYASYADWAAYWADRGDAPAGSQDAVEAALVKGCDYLGLRYEWTGMREGIEQALDWPRLYAYREPAAGACGVAIEGVPVEVVRANIELAKRALAGELAPDPLTNETGQVVTRSRVKAAAIEEEFEFNGGSAATFKRFPQVDEMLRKLVTKRGGRVYRA